MSRTHVHAPVKVQIIRSLDCGPYEGANHGTSWLPDDDEELEARIDKLWAKNKIQVSRYKTTRNENRTFQRSMRCAERATLTQMARMSPAEIAELDGDIEVPGSLRSRY